MQFNTLATIGATTGGGFDYVGQYVDTKGFTTGSWRKEQTIVAALTGGVSAPYAINYGVLGNTVLGAGIGVVNAGFSNQYYANDATYTPKNLTAEAVKGGVGGFFGFKVGDYTTNYMSNRLIFNTTLTYSTNGMREFSSYVGNTVGGSISGVTPILVDKSYETFKSQGNK